MFGATLRLQFLDACIGPLQRFILKQRGLHQRVNRIRRFAQAFIDGGNGVRVTRRALQLRESVEKIVNQLAFLRCHGFLSLASKREGRCRRALRRK